jgi:hypothetical protein
MCAGVGMMVAAMMPRTLERNLERQKLQEMLDALRAVPPSRPCQPLRRSQRVALGPCRSAWPHTAAALQRSLRGSSRRTLRSWRRKATRRLRKPGKDRS